MKKETSGRTGHRRPQEQLWPSRRVHPAEGVREGGPENVAPRSSLSFLIHAKQLQGPVFAGTETSENKRKKPPVTAHNGALVSNGQ